MVELQKVVGLSEGTMSRVSAFARCQTRFSRSPVSSFASSAGVKLKPLKSQNEVVTDVAESCSAMRPPPLCIEATSCATTHLTRCRSRLAPSLKVMHLAYPCAMYGGSLISDDVKLPRKLRRGAPWIAL